jgi:copper chaperone CopZ
MDQIKTTWLKVSGMTCGGCAANVKLILAARPGVLSVEVDLAGGKAGLRLRGDEASPEGLAAALAAAGYEARVLP